MSRTHPLAVLTRPEGRNTNVMHALLRRGWRVEECPALDIREVVAVSSVPRPESFDLIVFVSRAAVVGYHKQLAVQDSFIWPTSTLAACMGPVTAAAIHRAFGDAVPVLHPEPDRAQDSEALWPLLNSLEKVIKNVLIVRGQDGREWLSQRLSERGVLVTVHQAYSRQLAQWPEDLQDRFQRLQQQGVSPVWLLTSPHGVEAICKNLEALGLSDWFANSAFVFTHERLKPILAKLLNRSAQSLSYLVASPEDEVILASFEQLFLDRC